MVLQTHPLTRSRWGRALLGFIGVATFVSLWKYAQVSGWAAAGTIPDPFRLPQALADEWTSGRLMPAVLSSLIHYVWGLAIGTFLGFLVGALTASSSLLTRYTLGWRGFYDRFHHWPGWYLLLLGLK